MGEICAQNGVVVVADEIHQDIAFAPHRHHVFATLGEAYPRKLHRVHRAEQDVQHRGAQLLQYPDPQRAAPPGI